MLDVTFLSWKIEKSDHWTNLLQQRDYMLKELTKKDWMSLLAIPEDKIPEALILRGTRNLKTNYRKHKSYFENILEIDSPNSVFEDVLIGEYRNIHVGYASVYGDAMASEVTHVFGVLGTLLVVQTGCCGALKKGILPGDMICVTSAHCGEGASQYYIPEKEVSASSDLLAWINNENGPVSVHKGPVWTTSALLAEGRDDIEAWGLKGYIAVDMETASTFAVAEYFKMDRLSLLFVFDNPYEHDHLLLTDTEKQKRRQRGEKTMISAAFSVVEKYCESEYH